MLSLLLDQDGKSVYVFFQYCNSEKSEFELGRTQANLPGEKIHLSLKLSKLAKTARLNISLIKANGELKNQRKSIAQRKF